MGLLTNLIPAQYRVLAYAGILLIVVTGAFWKGYGCAATKYKAEIAVLVREKEEYAMQKRDLADRLLAKIGLVAEVIVTKYVDRVKIIKEKEYVYRNQAINNVPNQFELSAGWVYLHDSSARGSPADSARSADATPSGIADNQALAVIVTNNAAALANAEQLNALQQLIREYQKAVDEANAKIREINKNNKKGWDQ